MILAGVRLTAHHNLHGRVELTVSVRSLANEQAAFLSILYLKLQNVAWLHDKLTRCQDVVRVVLVLVGPVQVEGRVSAEAGRADGVRVKAPALLVGSALWLVGGRKRRKVRRRSQRPCPSHRKHTDHRRSCPAGWTG